MAIAGFYRRSLPSPPAIEFASPEGKEIFQEALKDGTMEGFFQLIAYFQTQAEPAFCALASLSVVLNALSIDPGKTWKGPWRWFDESMLECCEPLEIVKERGMTFAKVACAGACAGAAVHALRANASSLEEFRQNLILCSKSESQHMIVSYTRTAFQQKNVYREQILRLCFPTFLKQTGTGHFSPIGGYHTGRDLALILDVARFKYPPHWVPVSLLWEAIKSIDPDTGNYRGYMMLTKRDRPPSILYTLSCKDEIWRSISCYLIEDVPRILNDADINSVQDVVSIVLGLLPGKPEKFTSFVKWIAEVRRADNVAANGASEADENLNAKVKVMSQLRGTELYKIVFDWLSVSCVGCDCKLPSISGEDLPLFVRNACCHGAAVMSGMLYGSSGCCTNASVAMRVTNTGKETLVISGSIETVDGLRNHIDVLVPTSRCYGCGSGPNDADTCRPLHPSTGDLLTVLLFALPAETWKSVRNLQVQEKLIDVATCASLPQLLKLEMENLQEQLKLVHSWCLETDRPQSSEQPKATAISSTFISEACGKILKL
ncbi:hypothetical protein R1sor_023648 [Riccia sorocarpa]|uniref:glutathione gamma-glutamylcysteinyltransferase n=1 Tax=Riccia sorocarpa TaxID=122646 RepID=A0ABD3GR95_9MARC